MCWLSAEDVRRLLGAGEIEALRSKRGRVHRVRWRTNYAAADDPRRRYAIRTKGVGDSHNHEREDNPAGVWTIDRVRKRDREVFTTVLDDCMAA